jgi:hypothetical protein
VEEVGGTAVLVAGHDLQLEQVCPDLHMVLLHSRLELLQACLQLREKGCYPTALGLYASLSCQSACTAHSCVPVALETLGKTGELLIAGLQDAPGPADT